MTRTERRADRARKDRLQQATAAYTAIDPEAAYQWLIAHGANLSEVTVTRAHMWRENADGSESYVPVPDSEKVPFHKPHRVNVRGSYNGRGRAGKWRAVDCK